MSNFKIGNSKFARFVNGKGFYIALAVCLVAIGTAAYIAVNNSIGVQKNVENTASKASSASSIPNWDAQPTQKNVSGVSSSTPASSSKAASSSSSESSSKATQTKLVFAMPVPGKVLTQYSGDKLVSDVTMGDWRVHNGIDLGVDEGTAVKACAKGTVKEVKVDDMLGQMIVIDHGNGLRSYYCNLTDKVTVKKGQSVNVGDTIGAVGETAQAELALAPHLHFEMTKDGSQIDPLSKIGN